MPQGAEWKGSEDKKLLITLVHWLSLGQDPDATTTGTCGSCPLKFWWILHHPCRMRGRSVVRSFIQQLSSSPHVLAVLQAL